MWNILKLLATDAAGALESLPSGTESSSGFIQNVLNWVYGVSGIVAAGFIVFGAISYVLSQGEPDKIRKASQSITFSVIGLAVVLLAAAITNFILGAAGNAAP